MRSYNAIRLHEVTLKKAGLDMRDRKIFLQLFAEDEADVNEAASENSGIDDAAAVQNESSEEGDKENGVAKIAAALEIDGDADEIIRYINRERARRDLEKHLREEKAKSSYERLLSEAELLSKRISGFDIEKELENKKFAAMLHSGLTVEEAWNASHFDEIVGAAVESAKENVRREVMAEFRRDGSRPMENGAVGKAAVQSRGVENLTGRGIREILRRVEKGARIKL